MKRAQIFCCIAMCASGVMRTTPATAYPIDCAILLCLAGGFPASAECSAAKAEMIRRITPWPIEPPLQLWNCPMSIPADLAAALGGSVSLGADGLPDEVREYRDAVEVYHIKQYRRWRSSDGTDNLVDNTLVGAYDSQGDFHWIVASFESGPEWLGAAAGGYRTEVSECSLGADGCEEAMENRLRTNLGYLRAVAIRTKDYKGEYTVEFVRY